MDIVEDYLKRLNAPTPQKAIEFDDPKKFKFKPPGMDFPVKGIVKGEKPKFQRKSPAKGG